ncbi:aminotransferase class I/II-fold pyridoxal phosphate-dependent enzyme [bacterium]|nr:aminotransferase class I/II-fold pyridoxal phosphate-dependent enzyme [bacterium]
MKMEKLFNEDVMALDTYIMVRLKERTAQLKDKLTQKNRAPIALSMGAPTSAPPAALIDKLKEFLTEDNIHSYSVTRGENYFREACAQRMKDRFGVDIDPNDEVCSILGSKDGLANLIRFLIYPQHEEFKKDIILIPDPGYASYSQMVNCSGGKAYPMALTSENNYQPDMEQIWEKLKNEGYDENKVKAVIINYPNNPLGVMSTKEYVQSVVDFCKKHDILLISDAAYCDMYFDETQKPFSVLELKGAKDIAVEMFTLSKPYAVTGWRLGWVCGNKDVVSRFAKGKSTIDNGIFKALQKACAYIMTSPEGDDYIANGNVAYKRKQSILVKGMKELGWEIDENKIPKTTFYLWLPIPRKYDSSVKFCQDMLEKSGIVVVPGTAFGTYGEGFFRISYVCSDEKLQEVITRMKNDGFKY